jgi:hypothetical protein
MGMKNENSKKTCDNACGMLMFVALALIGVSQLNDEEGYNPKQLGNQGCAIRDQAACSMAGRSTYGCVSNEACCPCGDDEEEDCVPKYCAKTACKGGKCHPP